PVCTISTLSLHDALPISPKGRTRASGGSRRRGAAGPYPRLLAARELGVDRFDEGVRRLRPDDRAAVDEERGRGEYAEFLPLGEIRLHRVLNLLTGSVGIEFLDVEAQVSR